MCLVAVLLLAGCYKSTIYTEDEADTGGPDTNTSTSTDTDADADTDADTDMDTDTDTDADTDMDTDADTDIDTDTDTDTDTDIDTDTDTDCGDTAASTESFKGTVIGFGVDTPVPDLKVSALTNCDATPISGQEAMSDPSGTVEFTSLPVDEEGFVGFKVDGKPNMFVDTYQFNIDGASRDETIWSVDYATFVVAPAIAGVTIDKTKAFAAGAVYWVDGNGNKWPVGCATVEPASGTADMRYFGNNNMPAPIEEQASVNPDNGYWIGANITPGKVTFQAKIGSEVVGSATFHVFDGEAFTITNIYVDNTYTVNPGTCN